MNAEDSRLSVQKSILHPGRTDGIVYSVTARGVDLTVT